MSPLLIFAAYKYLHLFSEFAPINPFEHYIHLNFGTSLASLLTYVFKMSISPDFFTGCTQHGVGSAPPAKGFHKTDLRVSTTTRKMSNIKQLQGPENEASTLNASKQKAMKHMVELISSVTLGKLDFHYIIVKIRRR